MLQEVVAVVVLDIFVPVDVVVVPGIFLDQPECHDALTMRKLGVAPVGFAITLAGAGAG